MIINFVAEWDRKDKKQTWSGTTYALFEALHQYFDVKDIDVSAHLKTKYDILFSKIRRKLRLKPIQDFGVGANRAAGKYVRSIEVKTNNPIVYFQFSEMVKDNKFRKTYIFQDLSIDFLCHQFEVSQEEFAVGNFRDATAKIMSKRRKKQNNYYKQCAGIFTLSKWMQEDLINRMGIPSKKVHHVGGGINVNPNDIDYSHKEGNKTLFTGRDFERKGGYLVIEAFSMLRKKMPNAQLYIAGPTKNPINQDVEGIHFLGSLDRKQMSEAYNMCDVFCMPSYFEPYGLVFIEALTYGLPCIGRKCQEMPYFIEEGVTGKLIDSDDPETLSQKIYECLTDETIKSNVRSKRDYYMKEYNWDTVAQRIYNIIQLDLQNPNSIENA